ncbi:MAG TPA: phosphoribosyl-AMP cyclohydrolase [Deltaproteobacteria bacterium]|nr:phosphoribosyl-AMP cyclohydrolase [Deltaproteobacteria bacterium]
MNPNYEKILDQLKFDDQGLIGAIIQDAENGEILMFAFMNRESLKKTLETKLATYWSRSRKKLWVKGESSGHTQEVKEVYFDCDKDALLIKIKQNVAACHTGYRTCFFNKIEGDQVKTVGDKVFEEEKIYR